MTRFRTALLAAGLVSSLAAAPAAAEVANGSDALMISGLIGVQSPNVSAANKARLRRLMDGGAVSGPAFNVIASGVTCRSSNVAVGAFSCDLTFGTRTVHVSGRAAHELMATLTVAGIEPDGAAGSSYVGARNMRCRLEPATLADHGGGGAECNWDPAA